ncbi:DNA cytosine methyltransferase [Diaphorobacter sp. HDW4B]|uniref:DNA cytosine methyltransferase n=1 Tax=Diaphorobacter sp. HDW4B TaxID=2714925 RepID=UPI00140E3B23|nr:DNA (cytosine-5-)-methyltransferase [Diaphorobacter sp. HDW4B]QIL69094.1 DNA cytosine methyltransferase [Diaphorobacter sp. HDW4B]
MSVPIIDLFAGPGGLGEGFSSVLDHEKQPFFKIALSIEKSPVAHGTLTLRSVFRQLRGTEAVKHYYRYMRGEIDESRFRAEPEVAAAFGHALREARCLELGKSDNGGIDKEIRSALNGSEEWVLIGGPPCQAYSLAGRSRRANDETFESDEKHFLYQEYLRIIKKHKPAIFVMENVKGMLSSKHSGSSMFERIIDDLSRPAKDLEYEIRSFVARGDQNSLDPRDYVIESEKFGIPQARHRVILLGVRKGLNTPQHELLAEAAHAATVGDAIDSLPKIRSRLSRGDTLEEWRSVVQGAARLLPNRKNTEDLQRAKDVMSSRGRDATHGSVGAAFIPYGFPATAQSTSLGEWLSDPDVGGVCQHEARSHMASDLQRYMFASSYAVAHSKSPRLENYPVELLPNHGNVAESSERTSVPFNDRFRVQCRSFPATTVVAHIAKDGHYYIHYDPSQCRSLTVREAARLQTFPDNYFFMGNRTEQYTQIGNAVPPLLALKLGRVVKSLLQGQARSQE